MPAGAGSKRTCPEDADNAPSSQLRVSAVVERECSVALRESGIVARERSVALRESNIVARERSVALRESSVALREGEVEKSQAMAAPAVTQPAPVAGSPVQNTLQVLPIDINAEQKKSRVFVAECMDKGLRVQIVCTSTGKGYNIPMNGMLTIGKQESCDIVCVDTTAPTGYSRVSRKHCSISLDRNGLYVTVLSVVNSIFMSSEIGDGGRRCIIKPGCVMYLGNHSNVELLVIEGTCPVGLAFHVTANTP